MYIYIYIYIYITCIYCITSYNKKCFFYIASHANLNSYHAHLGISCVVYTITNHHILFNLINILAPSVSLSRANSSVSSQPTSFERRRSTYFQDGL